MTTRGTVTVAEEKPAVIADTSDWNEEEEDIML
jgi:hypothetical protein